MCRKFITSVDHIHNIGSQTMSKDYFWDFLKSPINEYSDLEKEKEKTTHQTMRLDYVLII